MRNKIVVLVRGSKGDDYANGDDIDIEVQSHWNNDFLVHIQVNKKIYTVSAKDLIDAIQRCSG